MMSSGDRRNQLLQATSGQFSTYLTRSVRVDSHARALVFYAAISKSLLLSHWRSFSSLPDGLHRTMRGALHMSPCRRQSPWSSEPKRAVAVKGSVYGVPVLVLSQTRHHRCRVGRGYSSRSRMFCFDSCGFFRGFFRAPSASVSGVFLRPP